MLIPILDWLLVQLAPESSFVPQWADLRGLKKPPRTLEDRIEASLFFYECDLLFVHRDAEGQVAEQRFNEIRGASEALGSPTPIVCVVPVRMSEAWLLVDETAIRRAADKPNGRTALNLPPIDRVELIPDPKAVLLEALRTASEARGRRLAKFDEESRRHRIAELIGDPSVLRRLAAFNMLEQELREKFVELGWA